MTHCFSPALSAVNAKNNAGNTPLHYAAINNRVRVARLLLENKADANAQNRVRARYRPTHPSPQAQNPALADAKPRPALADADAAARRIS